MKIVNIRYGKQKGRENTLYAELRNEKNELLISATLEYIIAQLPRYRESL